MTKYNTKFILILLLLTLACIMAFANVNFVYCSETENSLHIKEILHSIKGNKLFCNKKISDNDRKLAHLYSIRFYEKYDINRFDKMYSSNQRSIGGISQLNFFAIEM